MRRQKGPIPLAERHYSGRFNVRISPDLHRELAIRLPAAT
ncbi:MAG TPA: toxin-antitoxin system HicB family antitoxin [Mycobacterium sp.]|nr:toxin-antitoxin system HicB family antitoxin [Mycobacterium sp.]